MKLQKILDEQKKFQELLAVPIKSKKKRRYISDIFCTAMQKEVFELMGEYQNKLWDFKHRPDIKKTNIDNLKWEMCDVFLFFCNIMIVWNIDFEELLDLVEKRQLRNLSRATDVKFSRKQIQINL